MNDKRITSEVVKTTLKQGEAVHERKKKFQYICKKCGLIVYRVDKFCRYCGSEFVKNL